MTVRLSFYNICPVFEIVVGDPSVKNITVECHNTVIVGSVTASFNEDGTLDNAEKIGNKTKYFTIDIEAPGTYYAALVPAAIPEKGLKFIYKDADGNVVNSVTYPKALNLKAGQLYAWGIWLIMTPTPDVSLREACSEAICFSAQAALPTSPVSSS